MSGGGVGNILKIAAPLALSALIPGLGSALAPSLMGLGMGETAAGALSAGLINGAIGGGVGMATGSANPLQDALMGGAAGAAGNYFGGIGNAPTETSPLNSLGSDTAAIPNADSTGMSAPINQGGGVGGGQFSAGYGIPSASGADTSTYFAPAAAGGAPSTASQLGNYISKNPLQAALIGGMGMTALDSMMPQKKQETKHSDGYDDKLPDFHIDQSETPYSGDWYTYGMTPQQPMIKRNLVAGLKKGGIAANPLEFTENGVVPGSGKGGHADDVPAMLSEDEYVIPAEVVSALGDGSSKAGGKKLDQMVKNVRKHKATKGFPPKALNPLSYIKEA